MTGFDASTPAYSNAVFAVFTVYTRSCPIVGGEVAQPPHAMHTSNGLQLFLYQMPVYMSITSSCRGISHSCHMLILYRNSMKLPALLDQPHKIGTSSFILGQLTPHDCEVIGCWVV